MDRVFGTLIDSEKIPADGEKKMQSLDWRSQLIICQFIDEPSMRSLEL